VQDKKEGVSDQSESAEGDEKGLPLKKNPLRTFHLKKRGMGRHMKTAIKEGKKIFWEGGGGGSTWGWTVFGFTGRQVETDRSKL